MQTTHPDTAVAAHSAPRTAFLTEAECKSIAQRLASATTGGGVTMLTIWSHGVAHVRWARNQLVTSSSVRNHYIQVNRDIGGAQSTQVLLNQVDDAALAAAAVRAERLVKLHVENAEWDLGFKRRVPEDVPAPQLFSTSTAQLDAEQLAHTAVDLTKGAAAAGVLSAGDIDISANSIALIDSLGQVRYVPYTQAGYSVTVRDPEGTGSGWAGVDWPDWTRIDAPALTATALDKCLTSRHPVAVEPGRYTTILEPQAVADFVGQLMRGDSLSRRCAQWDCSGPTAFSGPRPQLGGNGKQRTLGMTRLGEKIADERVSIWADPMDPELGFVPFSQWFIGFHVYHPAQWIKDGVLAQLDYDRGYAVQELHQSAGLPNSGAFRMSGGTTSVAEMIATTKRGLLVTRFDDVRTIDPQSLLCRGYTRDGLWLIEGGKISKPVKNLVFTESVLFALNNVDQLGVPQRVYHPAEGRVMLPQPTVVPPIKVKDFSFTALADAV